MVSETRSLLLEDTSRVGFTPARWVAPLPPLLSERVPAAEAERHDALVRRYEAALKRAGELAAEIEHARAQDHERTLSAVEAGRKPPPERAPKLEAELSELRRATAALAELIPGSGQRLLDSVAEEVDAARADAYAAANATLPELERLAVQMESELNRVGLALSQAGWLTTIATRGHAGPYSATSSLGRLHTVQHRVRELRASLTVAIEKGIAPVPYEEPAEQIGSGMQLKHAATLTPERKRRRVEESAA